MTELHLGLKLNAASVIFVILVLFSVVWTSKADCPVNFLQLHNKCYYFSNDVESWRNAYFRCAALNSTLVTLKSKHNSKRLTEYLLKEHLGTKEWWIGASYDWIQKLWKWGVEGRPVKFNHFVRAAEKTKLDWHCAFLDQRHQYKWNAEPCTRKKYYICMQNIPDFDGTENDKDNQIPVIVSRDLLEEQHLKRDSAEPGFITAPKASPGTINPKQKPKPQHKYMCPKGFGYVRNACYKFSKTLATWQEAYFNCNDVANGTLAIIPDRKYDRGIRRYAKRIGANIHERWIGGIYDWQKTAWKWATNGIIIQHQERDKELLKWHCLIWSPLITDKWTSDSCVIKKHYICQTTPKILVPMELRGRPSGTSTTRTKVTDKRRPEVKRRGEHKFDYDIFLEFRTNATQRQQKFYYKPTAEKNKMKNNMPY